MATERHRPDLAVPQGDFLAETWEEIGMSQAALARQMGRPVQAVNEIVRGKKEITPETALQLEKTLGIPASWQSDKNSLGIFGLMG
jgi:HTH-type transcriptional regulator / antitoxin HigA